MNSRRSLLAVVAAVAVLAATIGWVAGQRIKSPADIAAESEAPEASLITVPVEKRALSSNVVIRGQVEFSESEDLFVSAGQDGVAIITRLPVANGDTLEEGSVVVEVAGRPVFVLQGELPTFRSLTPTLDGPDVQQLEEALVRLGLDPGEVDGVYDVRTENAVSALYRNAGFTANEPSLDELDRLDQARSSLRQARDNLSELERGSTSDGLPESTRLELDRAVNNAEGFYNDAVTARDTAVAEAQTAVDVATADVVAAQEAADTAAARVVQAEGGVHPDTGQPPTNADLVALRDERTATANILADAIAAETDANIELTRVKKEQDGFVSNAKTDWDIAKAARSEAIEGAKGTSSADQLRNARDAVNTEQTNLNRLEAEIGVSFPASELVFLPTLPSEVQNVRSSVGDIPQGAVMTVTGSGVRIVAQVAAADRSLLEVGAEAIMEDRDLGLSIPAVITFVADDPGGQDVSADRYIVRLEPVGELPEEAIGRNLRVTVPFASTDGEVLAVPLAALSAGADGTIRVEVERADGSIDLVTVVTGLNARAVGLVEITPVEGDLEEGDRVVVGRDQTTASVDGDAEGSEDPEEGDGSEEDAPAEEEGEG